MLKKLLTILLCALCAITALISSACEEEQEQKSEVIFMIYEVHNKDKILVELSKDNTYAEIVHECEKEYCTYEYIAYYPKEGWYNDGCFTDPIDRGLDFNPDRYWNRDSLDFTIPETSRRNWRYINNYGIYEYDVGVEHRNKYDTIFTAQLIVKKLRKN